MAEALTLIGGLAAIMQLSGSLVKLTKDLVVCVRTIRSAPKEIEGFILETQIFTAELYYFHDLAQESAKNSNQKFKAKRAELVQKIARQCRFVRRGFAHLVKLFVEINGPSAAPFNTFLARILWLWKKPDVPELRLSIQSATANVLLLCNLFVFEEMKRRNENDGRLETLREQLQIWVSTARKLRRELAKHQRRKQPLEREPDAALDKSYDTITEDSRDLERYVVNAIRPHAQNAAVSRGPGSSRREPPSRIEREIRTVPSSGGPRMDNAQVDALEIIGQNRQQTSDQSPEEIIEVSNPHAPHLERVSSGIITRNIPEERSPSRSREAQSPSLTPLEEFRQRTFGSRVRDQGNGVHMEAGERPTEVHDSNIHVTKIVNDGVVEQPPQTTSQPHIEEERRRESVSELSPEDAGQREEVPDDGARLRVPSRPSSLVEERSERERPSVIPKKSSAIELEGSQHSHSSSGQEISSPYKPIPPFGGPRSRRRPRRPRPQSPIG
ncbi:hypothetical protein F5Y06DRAFT_292545 [Hypoxylon sp. FL0890]|nr:hypothetical protein F5Y06DRAFT_292545 [Hypoxylon sp. FL0890]